MSLAGLRSLLLGIALANAVGCASPFARDLDPRPLSEMERGEYQGPPPEILGEASDGMGVVERLARVFYVRLINRRFNSIATFHDPALRELFGSDEAFADYFAAMAEALTVANFEALRPTSVELTRLDVPERGVVVVTVRMTGQNSLPLRWWRVGLERTDRWQFADGRWYIIPGKL